MTGGDRERVAEALAFFAGRVPVLMARGVVDEIPAVLDAVELCAAELRQTIEREGRWQTN